MSSTGPWNPLTVSAPSAPGGRLNNTSRTSARIARNVAVLFGIEAPDSADGSRVRLSDYNALTNADIGRGAPPDAKRPDSTPIAAATLSKYGPETKAALVLTGANQLFESVQPTMREVLDLVSQARDTRQLADSMRITAWAALLLDVYEAQPALLVAALQARAVQRGALIDWTPWVDEDAAPQADSVEFGTARNRAGSAAGRSRDAKTLGIFDGLMDDKVKPEAISGDYDANNALLSAELVDRFASHLLRGSMVSGLARVTIDPAGNRRMDVALDRLPLLVDFTEANMQLYHLVEPCGDTIRPPHEPAADREPFDPTNDTHWRRLLPRVPTTPELTRFDPKVQYETIRVLVLMLRVLRVTRKVPRKTRTACRELMGEVATVAEELFGADSLPALETRAAHLAAIASDLRYRKVRGFDTPYESTLEAGQALFEIYVEVRDRYRDLMEPGAWLEFIDKLSGRLDAYAVEIADGGDAEGGRAIQRQLCEDWEDAFTRLGIDPLTRQPHVLKERCRGLAHPLHSWVALALRMTDDPKLYRRALLMAKEVVVPMRRELARLRINDRTYRDTLEEVSRGVAEGLDSLPPGEAAEALDYLVLLGRALLNTSRVQQLLGMTRPAPGTQLTDRDAVTVVALVRICVTLKELHPTAPDLLSADQVSLLLGKAHDALSELAESDEPKRSRVLTQLDGLAARWAARVGAPA